ncbi:hypothetical protein GCM10018966_090510 [Streptomyces yanii]
MDGCSGRDVAALTALLDGATYVVREGTHPAEAHAYTCAVRLRHTRRRGIETLGLERAVQPLRSGGNSKRLSHVPTTVINRL